MSDPLTETDEPNRMAEPPDGIQWAAYLKLLAAVAIGLAVNGLVVVAIIGGSFAGILDGLIWLTPAAFIAVAAHHRYNPITRPILGSAFMFLAILAAQTLTVTVRRSEAVLADPVVAMLLLAAVALMFTPGPFLAAWVTRRWLL